MSTAADLKDPSNAASDVYIGAKPVVPDAARVIHGNVKYWPRTDYARIRLWKTGGESPFFIQS
jgi:hypothetical protein